MTGQGGVYDLGAVYKITSSGVETVIYSFGTVPDDGSFPGAALAEGGDGNFYGTTQVGGTLGRGTIFKITPSGTETVLYNFGTNPDDGAGPSVLVLGSDGNFYGTTNGGGSQESGVFFQVTPSGTETVLYAFGADPNDGQIGTGIVEGSDGNFYGSTSAGGSEGFGTVFSITPLGEETVLYSFGASAHDGKSPVGLAKGSDGNFYEPTGGGGSRGLGAVCRITPLGAETVLYGFDAASDDGYVSFVPVVQGSDGNFYGTTSFGGTAAGGTAFKITPSGMETVLYSFGADPNDGTRPNGLVPGSDGNFYGSTARGGSHGKGTVFKVTPLGAETVLYNFGANADDAIGAAGALVEGSDGNFYGVTLSGGSQGKGTVFKVTPLGVESVLYAFGSNANDATMPSALLQGSDGNFYGTTVSGGTQDLGTVFRMTPSGTETVLYSFGTNPNDGLGPKGLLQASDGNFYGTTSADGTIFRMTPSGTETVLYSFGTNPNDGISPSAPIQGHDGNLYGTTSGGGSLDGGTIFKITLSGTESVLYNFATNPNQGINTGAALIQGSDGNLYGTTDLTGELQGGGTVSNLRSRRWF